MNNQEKFDNDPLRKFMSHEMIQKAPEGLTAKVMETIAADPVPVWQAGKRKNRNLVPVISVLVFIMLLAATLLAPENSKSLISLPALKLINNIKISWPDFDFGQVFKADLPVTLLYILAGLILLSLFDKVLSGAFHREK